MYYNGRYNRGSNKTRGIIICMIPHYNAEGRKESNNRRGGIIMCMVKSVIMGDTRVGSIAIGTIQIII